MSGLGSLADKFRRARTMVKEWLGVPYGSRPPASATSPSPRDAGQTPASRPEEHQAWLRIWHILNGSKANLPAALETPSVLLSKDFRIEARFDRVPLDIRRRLEPAARERLLAYGITPDFLDFDTDFFEFSLSPSVEYAIENRRYRSSCPFSGRTIFSADAFFCAYPEGRPYVIVRHEAEGRAFYEIFDGFGGAKIGAYFPDMALIISRLKLETVIRSFHQLVLRNINAYLDYLRGSIRRTAIPINTITHCGHWLLCELEAIRIIAEKYGKQDVDAWADLNIYYIRVQEIYPEIEATHVLSDAEEMFRVGIENNFMFVLPRITNYFIGEQAIRSLRTAAQDAEKEPAHRQLTPSPPTRKPRLWIELRANDRLWINQREVLRACIDRLRARYPELQLVFAGWSRMNCYRAEDEKMIAVEKTAVESMLAEFSSMDPVFVSGVTFDAKLAVARSCNFHVSTHGTGVLFPLIAEVPGAMVTNRGDMQRFRQPDGSLRPPVYVSGQPPLTLVPEELVLDEPGAEHWQKRSFRVDPERFAEFLEKSMTEQLGA
jgi:hypothetical protein